MTSDDERAATERMRLLLVHDSDSEARNLAPEPTILDVHDEHGHLIPECFDLSRLEVSRFAARATVTRETEGHRQAVYSTSANPAVKAPVPLAMASVLLTEPSTEPALASSQDIAAREAATVRRREIPLKESSRDFDTVPEGRVIETRRTKRATALVTGFVGAALLLIVIVASLGRRGSEPLPSKSSASPAPTVATAVQSSESLAAPSAPLTAPPVKVTSAVVAPTPAEIPNPRKAAPAPPRKPDSKAGGTEIDLGAESETTRF